MHGGKKADGSNRVYNRWRFGIRERLEWQKIPHSSRPPWAKAGIRQETTSQELSTSSEHRFDDE